MPGQDDYQSSVRRGGGRKIADKGTSSAAAVALSSAESVTRDPQKLYDQNKLDEFPQDH